MYVVVLSVLLAAPPGDVDWSFERPSKETRPAVRPRLETANGADVLKAADQLGLRTIVWTGGCLPSYSPGCDAFFQNTEDARHVVIDGYGPGDGPRVVFVYKDGTRKFVRQKDLSAAKADQVKRVWRPETVPAPLPALRIPQ